MAGDGSSHKLRWSEKKVTQKRRGGNRIRLERVDSGGGGGLVCVCSRAEETKKEVLIVCEQEETCVLVVGKIWRLQRNPICGDVCAQ